MWRRRTKLLEAGKAAEAQALLRGWMTVIIELMENADDSFGSIGMSFDDGFTAYLKIPLDETGIDEAVFFPDLLDFLIWEDYGLTDDGIEGYFKGLTPAQADLCIEHLRRADRRIAGGRPGIPERGGAHAPGSGRRRAGAVRRVRGTRQGDGVTGMAADHPPGRPGDEEAEEAPGDQGLRGGDDEGGSTWTSSKKKYEKLKRGHWSPDPRK